MTGKNGNYCENKTYLTKPTLQLNTSHGIVPIADTMSSNVDSKNIANAVIGITNGSYHETNPIINAIRDVGTRTEVQQILSHNTHHTKSTANNPVTYATNEINKNTTLSNVAPAALNVGVYINPHTNTYFNQTYHPTLSTYLEDSNLSEYLCGKYE